MNAVPAIAADVATMLTTEKAAALSVSKASARRDGSPALSPAGRAYKANSGQPNTTIRFAYSANLMAMVSMSSGTYLTEKVKLPSCR